MRSARGSMKGQAKRPDHHRRARWLGPALLAVGAAATVALVALALGPGLRGGSPVSDWTPPPSETARQVTPSAPPVEPSPSPGATPPPSVSAPAAGTSRLLIAASDDGALLRAMPGLCAEEPGTLEISADAGASWQPAATGAFEGAAIRQIDAEDPTMLELLYLDSACTAATARSFVAGVDWEASDTGAPWYADADPGVASALGRSPSPAGCETVALTVSGERALALCSDSTLRMSFDAGTTWSDALPRPGAVAVGVDDSGFIVAITGDPGCEGLRIALADASGVGAPSGCFPSDAPASEVAVAGRGGTVYLWAGDRVVSSSDGGQTWA